jgi:hypothetical protein
MFVNGKKIPVETVTGMGGGIKENGSEDKLKYDIFDVLKELL